MKLEMKLILLCHIALFVPCKSGSKKSSGNDKEKEYTLGGPLNETEINAKYVFETEISDRGGYAEIYRGTTKAEPKIHVVMKLETRRGRFDGKATKEIKVYRHLHETYGDLVQHHLINMLDHGTYKDGRNAIIFLRTGPSINKKEAMGKLRLSDNKPDWPKICKTMTEVLHALKYLHCADVIHLDIWKYSNVVFGREKTPAKGKRLPGVTYESDAYVLDLGDAEIITKDHDEDEGSRFDDLVSIGRLLCSILIGAAPSSKFVPHMQPNITTYIDYEDPYKTFSPEIKASLVGYHEAIKKLYQKRLNEQQLKTEIDYNRLCSFFK